MRAYGLESGNLLVSVRVKGFLDVVDGHSALNIA